MEVHFTEIVFVITALLGGIMHYIKKYMRGETTVKLYEWYGPANLPSTIYTVTVFFFAIVGALAADVINSETGFWAAMYSGFVTGFAIDAGINSEPNLNRTILDNKNELNELFHGGTGQDLPPQNSAPNVVANDSNVIIIPDHSPIVRPYPKRSD